MSKIKITLHSDLCAASGSGFGNMIDTDIALDHLGIPYIPGRRIKGCLRQSAEDLRDYGCETAINENIEKLFGHSDGLPGALTVDSAFIPNLQEVRKAILSAQNEDPLSAVSSPARVPDLFTYVRGSTAMEAGKAKDGSLRFTRVVSHYSALNPDQEAVFECNVQLDDPSLEELLRLCCLATRHIGHSRNRGLGDVSLEYIPSAKAAKSGTNGFSNKQASRYIIEYRVHLDAPMMIPGVDHHIAAVSSRAVIGCLSAAWLKAHTAEDPVFRRLFLTGEVQWQELTPVVHGMRSFPAPRFLARLKSAEPKLINTLAVNDDADEHAKKKPLDGCFTCANSDGFDLVSVLISSAYHHSTEKDGKQGSLYVEESLDSGVVYGGAVVVPADLADVVLKLISSADFRFGRSRSAQYGACQLIGQPYAEPFIEESLTPAAGETVYAILLSDLMLYQNGISASSAEKVRFAISQAAGLPDQKPLDQEKGIEKTDSCSYRDLGGYHQMWQMRKNVCTVLCAGSYFQFVSDGKPVPKEIRLGEYPQEGMGRIRLVPDSELRKMNRLKEAVPDNYSEADQPSAEMRTALIVQAARDALKSSALNYAVKNPKLREDIQIGRLRLMLADSSDLADLIKRVGSIKTESYQKNALKLLRSLYSGDIPEKINPKNPPEITANPDPEVMFIENPGIRGLIQEDPEAKKRICAAWKRYLSAVLSLAYYQERKEEA